MGGFWPHVPYIIPSSQGMPMWWDILWWVFQIVIMTAVLLLLRVWATKVDRANEQEQTAAMAAAKSGGADSN